MTPPRLAKPRFLAEIAMFFLVAGLVALFVSSRWASMRQQRLSESDFTEFAYTQADKQVASGSQSSSLTAAVVATKQDPPLVP